MKHRKILSTLLALVMVMALTVPALAASIEVAGKDGGSLKISDATADGKIEMYFGPCDLYRVPVDATMENTDGTLSGIAVLPVVQDTDGTWKLIYEDDYEGVWPAWEEGVAKRTFGAGTEGYWLVEGYNSNDDTLVRFAVKVEGASAPTQPTEPENPTEPEQPAEPAQPAGGTYTVKYGDTWGQLALNNYGSYGAWRLLWKANGCKGLSTGKDIVLPEKLGSYTRLPAQVLAEGEKLYTVKAGDTLGQIAVATYKDINMYKAIFDRNADRLKNANSIYEGQIIVLPVKPAK